MGGTTNTKNIYLKIQWTEFHQIWCTCSGGKYEPKSEVSIANEEDWWKNMFQGRVREQSHNKSKTG